MSSPDGQEALAINDTLAFHLERKVFEADAFYPCMNHCVFDEYRVLLPASLDEIVSVQDHRSQQCIDRDAVGGFAKADINAMCSCFGFYRPLTSTQTPAPVNPPQQSDCST